MQDKQSDKMFFYESFATQFDSAMNMYDTQKRVDVFFNEILKGHDLKNKNVLDAGCGTGWFSKAAVERGGEVTSLDVGEKLLQQVAQKCQTNRVIGSVLDLPFEENVFDFVISSEVIEHTPNPKKAIEEMYRVLKPGGTLVLSTPNIFWYWTLWVANILKIRPYQGLENWSSYFKLKRTVHRLGFKDIKMSGVHLLPFVHPITYPVNNFFHRFNKVLAPFMVNLVVEAKK